MKKWSVDPRIVASFFILALGFAGSYGIPIATKSSVVSTSFPAQACPVISTAGSTSVYLPSTKLNIRFIDSKSTRFSLTSRSVIPLTNHALLVDSNPGTSLSFASSPGSGLAVTPCSPGSPDEWFIGGSGGLTSKGTVDLVNSGLSTSSVEIYPFTSKVALPAIPVVVKANSSATLSLDALAPGEESMALHVITRTGRVSTFLLDQRSKGLRSLGMDFVKPWEAPQTDLTFSGIYPHNGGKSSVQNYLRLLVPGSLDANVRLEAISSDGKFIPLGFDGIAVKRGQVLTLPLTNLTTNSAFALHLHSDQPVLAGVLTTMGSGDFAWASPSNALTKAQINFGGATPVVVFTGATIQLHLTGRYINGKNFSQEVHGSDLAIWSPKIGVSTVHFSSSGKPPVYAGAIINSGGLTYFPISDGGSIENTALPFSDVHTLTR